MPSAGVSNKMFEGFWPASAVRKLLNMKSDATEFSADSDEDIDFRARNRIARRFSESGLPQTHFTYSEDYSIFVGTWNVAGKPPSDSMDLKQWLGVREGVDIYVIGFQEIVPLNPGNVLGAEDEGPATAWDALIRKTLNGDARQTKSAPSSPWREDGDGDDDEDESSTSTSPSSSQDSGESPSESFNVHKKSHSMSGGLDLSNMKLGKSLGKSNRGPYVRIISKQMVGIFITVWVRRDLRRFFHDVKVSCVGCGLMGYYGNKGSVSVSMSFDQTSFCFVCTHLTSGEKEGDELRRNSDVIEILKRTVFPGESSPSSILAHDRVIWLGDLNYRLSLSNDETKSLLESEDWDALLRKDQLRDEQKAGGVFYGWHEGGIEFAPTYKYKANSTEYSNGGERQRTPAWCDRVLWKGKGLRQMDYFRTEYIFSDHRPVAAVFRAEVELVKRRGFMRRPSQDLQMGVLRSFNEEMEKRGDPFRLGELRSSLT